MLVRGEDEGKEISSYAGGGLRCKLNVIKICGRVEGMRWYDMNHR